MLQWEAAQASHHWMNNGWDKYVQYRLFMKKIIHKIYCLSFGQHFTKYCRKYGFLYCNIYIFGGALSPLLVKRYKLLALTMVLELWNSANKIKTWAPKFPQPSNILNVKCKWCMLNCIWSRHWIDLHSKPEMQTRSKL